MGDFLTSGVRAEGPMKEKPIRVLVVDDSATMREVLAEVLSATPGMEVVGMAADGRQAVAQVIELAPDLVTLDVCMPHMSGLEVLDALLVRRPTPVIMVSALTVRDADITWQALERGALDYVAKPESPSDKSFAQELVYKVRAMAGADVKRILRIRRLRRQTQSSAPVSGEAKPVAASNLASAAGEAAYDGCIAIGISTGGPPALSALFQALKPPMPPILVVQHMPPRFTGPFAQRLNSISAIQVCEAVDGMPLAPNLALVAPGGMHLSVRSYGDRRLAVVRDGELTSGHKPSVDVLMQAAAEAFGARLIGVIMTGMGHDGVEGCRRIRAGGGYVLGQDESTSDVYGMNKAAFVAGHVDRQFALDELPQLLRDLCRRRLPRKSPAGVPTLSLTGSLP